MTRAPVAPTPRGHAPKARRIAVLAQSGGHCAYPGCTVTTGLERDHIVALELGGRDKADNEQMLCVPHHKSKTALDVKLIAKARRLRKKNGFEAWNRKPRKPITSRGFDKTRTRKFSGEVVAR